MAERGAHQELGCHSIVQYAETRYHIQPSTTREYLAIGRALEELPVIDEAFCQGRLMWSHVRQIVRVATPQTEAVWAQWALSHTAREIAGCVRQKQKGDLPTDPARRRIHAIMFKLQVNLNALQWQMWNNARAKLEAEGGAPASDADVLMRAAMLVLDTRPDGSVPGRTPVKEISDSHQFRSGV